MPVKNLDRYRTALLELRARLRGEVNRMIDAVQEDIKPSGNLSNAPIHLADEAAEGVDAEVHLIENERGILSDVEDALVRIEDGTFGQCTECGKSIAEPRLQAIPYAPHCIECASKLQSSPE